MKTYVRTFLMCQEDKVEQQQPRGLLEPLPIADPLRKRHYGLHHRPTQVQGIWIYHYGGGPVF